MAEVNLDRMEKLIGMGYDKDKAYEMVKAEADTQEAEVNKEKDKEAEYERMKAELEEIKKKQAETEGQKNDETDKKKEDKVLGTNSIKTKEEESYIDVLKKFC